MSDVSIEQVHPAEAEGHASAQHNENLKFGMWLFLASEVVIFAMLIGVFIVFRLANPERIVQVHEASGILLVSLNTFLLLTSSWAMVMGLRAIQANNQKGLVRWISLTALLGVLFVSFQYVEYSTLATRGHHPVQRCFRDAFLCPDGLSRRARDRWGVVGAVGDLSRAQGSLQQRQMAGRRNLRAVLALRGRGVDHPVYGDLPDLRSK